jgi:hypothetical protein
MWAKRRKSLIIQFLGHKSPTLMPMAGARRNETIKRVIKRGKSRAIKPQLARPLLPSSNQQNSQSALFKHPGAIILADASPVTARCAFDDI